MSTSIRLQETIREDIRLMELWINDSKSGGWSTHLVTPMQNRVNHLKSLLYDLNN